jgi:CheY-like chemotaxis protein
MITIEDAAKLPTVLVLEDEPLLRSLAVDMLEAIGFRAVLAPNVDQALLILEGRGDINAVFTDVNLPGSSVDGISFAHTVRSRWPAVLILVTSGWPLDVSNRPPAGSCFLPRPYGLRDLENTLMDLFA